MSQRITKTNVRNRIEYLNKQLADIPNNNIEYELMQFGSGTYHLVSRIPGTNGHRNEINGSLKEIDKTIELLRNYLYRVNN